MDKKKQILEKTKVLIFKMGVKSTTMDDISQEVGISKKTLYGYFPNKEVLVRETLRFYLTEVEQVVSEINKRNLNAIEKWFTILEDSILTYQFDEIKNTSIQIKKYYPEIFDEIQSEQWNITQENFRKIILEGILDGLFREDFDVSLFLKFYYAGASNLCESSLFENTSLSHKSLIIKYLKFCMRSIATAKGLEKIEEIVQS